MVKYYFLLVIFTGSLILPSAEARQNRVSVYCENKKNDCFDTAIFFDQITAEAYKKKYEKNHPGQRCVVGKDNSNELEKQDRQRKDGNVK